MKTKITLKELKKLINEGRFADKNKALTGSEFRSTTAEYRSEKYKEAIANAASNIVDEDFYEAYQLVAGMYEVIGERLMNTKDKQKLEELDQEIDDTIGMSCTDTDEFEDGILGDNDGDGVGFMLINDDRGIFPTYVCKLPDTNVAVYVNVESENFYVSVEGQMLEGSMGYSEWAQKIVDKWYDADGGNQFVNDVIKTLKYMDSAKEDLYVKIERLYDKFIATPGIKNDFEVDEGRFSAALQVVDELK